MKAKDIRLGDYYAVKLVLPYAAHMARTTPIIHARAIDTAGNTVIFEYDTADCGLAGEALERLRAQRQRLFPARNYDLGRELLRVKAADVVCNSDEWTPPAPDGRMDAPIATRAAGSTFEQHQMAHA